MSRRQDEYDEELREHIEIETRENIERGMPPNEARLAAIRTFGNPGVVRQQLREGGPFYWIETLLQDIRYGLRLVKRSPLLAFATVLTLTLGIGMNTGVFTVLNGFIMRARVDKDPDTFAHVFARYSGDVGRVAFDSGVSTADFRAYQRDIRSMENIAAWGIGRSTLGRDDPAQLLIMPVTCNFFSLYGLDRPKLGRLFRAEECATPGADAVVVISEELWRSQFSADPQILGAMIRLNQQPFTIVGVTPARFAGQLRGPGIWVPITMQAAFFGGNDFLRNSSVPWLVLEGRLKSGQTRASAQAELAVIAHQQDRLQPGRKTTIFVTNGSFIQDPGSPMRWVGPLIMGALTLILLLACTNVTMLLLSRAASRQREIAIRLSLGAGRKRLLRMLLTESLILAIAAGAISAWIAHQVPGLMEKFIPGMPHYPLQPDMLVFAYLGGDHAAGRNDRGDGARDRVLASGSHCFAERSGEFIWRRSQPKSRISCWRAGGHEPGLARRSRTFRTRGIHHFQCEPRIRNASGSPILRAYAIAAIHARFVDGVLSHIGAAIARAARHPVGLFRQFAAIFERRGKRTHRRGSLTGASQRNRPEGSGEHHLAGVFRDAWNSHRARPCVPRRRGAGERRNIADRDIGGFCAHAVARQGPARRSDSGCRWRSGRSGRHCTRRQIGKLRRVGWPLLSTGCATRVHTAIPSWRASKVTLPPCSWPYVM